MGLELGIVGFALTPVHVKVSEGSGGNCSYVGGLVTFGFAATLLTQIPPFCSYIFHFMFTRLMRYMKDLNINVFTV